MPVPLGDACDKVSVTATVFPRAWMVTEHLLACVLSVMPEQAWEIHPLVNLWTWSNISYCTSLGVC